MDGIFKAAACTFRAKIGDIFILMGPMIAQADMMECVGRAEVSADLIGMERDEYNITKAAWDDGEFDDRLFIADYHQMCVFDCGAWDCDRYNGGPRWPFS